MIIQVIGVQYRRAAIAVHKNGITGRQWLVCVLFGAGELVWQQVINVVHHFTSGGDEHVEKGYRDAGILKIGSGRVACRRRCGPRRRGRTSRRSATFL